LNSEDYIARAAAPRGDRFGIAFGTERLALIPFRAPAATVLIALALAVLAVLGLQRIQIDDSLSQLFRSESPAFKLFEQVSHDFPSSEYDVMIVVTGDSLVDRESVEKLCSLTTDVQLIEGTRGALSMFSARQPAPEGGLPEPVFPEPLPQGSAYHQLVEQALSNDIIHGRLLWADGRLALIILSLEPSVVDGGQLDSIVTDIRQTMAEDLDGSRLTAELTGVPVMQLEIRHALERDRILYNAVGFVLGCVVAALFFRRRQSAAFVGEIIAPASTAAVSLFFNDQRQALSVPAELLRDYRRPHC
jgi:predicted RND superfamily exporter protein